MAKEYDPPPHRHSDDCYRVTLQCAIPEHEHGDRSCYYQRGPSAGQLKCSLREHAHQRPGCYGAVGPLCGHP